MTTPLLHDERMDTSPRTQPDDGCPACAHPVDQHDPIATRFCRATATGALDRGCVCSAP